MGWLIHSYIIALIRVRRAPFFVFLIFAAVVFNHFAVSAEENTVTPEILATLEVTVTPETDTLPETLVSPEALSSLEVTVTTKEVSVAATRETAAPSTKKVYLTFDDGPNLPGTARVLDLLKKEGVKATFFVNGYRAVRYPELLRRITQEGHSIGNHGYSHRLSFFFKSNIAGEIEKTSEIVYRATGKKTNLFRPPWGIVTPALRSYLKKNGQVMVFWNVDPRDWTRLSSQVIAERVLKKVRPNAIVLLHDGIGNRLPMLRALPLIIKKLKAKNYTFAALPEDKIDKTFIQNVILKMRR